MNEIMKITLPTPFPVGDVNAYLLKGDALTLVDVGPLTEEAKHSLDEQLNDAGYSINDIEQIVLTHHHPDHAGMLDHFSEDAVIYGHPYNKHWLQRGNVFDEVYTKFYHTLFLEGGVPEQFLSLLPRFKAPLKYLGKRNLDVTVLEGDKIPGLEDWSILETLGHAQSHVSFYREKDGVLIAGDHLLAHISPNPLLEPSFHSDERPKPILQYIQSLKKLQQLDISIAYTGHGENIENAAELIQSRLQKQHERALYAKHLLQDGSKTIYELCQLLFPKIYQKELGLTFSETVAQTDYLKSIDQIDKIVDNGTHFFSAKG